MKSVKYEIKTAVTAGRILCNASTDCDFDLYREKSQFGSLLKKILISTDLEKESDQLKSMQEERKEERTNERKVC